MSTVQDSLTRQQFSMIMSNLLQSLRITCSFTVFPSVRIAVLDHHCPLFPFNGCLSVIVAVVRIRKLCSTFTSDAIKRIFTNFKNFVKFANFCEIREFLRILNSEVTNFQSSTDNLTKTTKRQNTQITQNNTTQNVALVNSTTDTFRKTRLRDRTDRAWFNSHLSRHLDSGQETERVYSYNPGARTGLAHIMILSLHFIRLSTVS